jgi:hypothetical protein
VAKGFALFFVQLWVRWTLPRIRLDQVMYACVQGLLPVMMVLLLGNTFWLLWVPPGGAVHWIVNIVLTGFGLLTLAAVVAIIAYGYAHRRQLVGTQYVDALPGA